MMRSRLPIFAATLVLLAAMVQTGCATKKYVRGEVSTSEDRLGSDLSTLSEQVEKNQTQLAADGRRLDDHDQAIDSASKTARDALERALAAGKLAEGKLLYETVFTDDQVRFDFEQATLNEAAQQALDSFASPLRDSNQGVFIEIQGHTDSSGPEEFNLALGQSRAEAVRRYLNSEHAIPLHRMSVISYGETEPVADNDSREGRKQNRRVVLVVLR